MYIENMQGKWGYSTDGESFQGYYDTPEEAKNALFHVLSSEKYSRIKTGNIAQYVKPIEPSTHVYGN